MIFNTHSKYEGQHAFLGASRYHWINYTDERLDDAYLKWLAVSKGTELHAFAAEAIRLGIKLPDTRATLNMYVNDAIGFGMTPEQVLYYSDNCFGTADAIAFNDGFLRIHDLKTGESRTSLHQLEIYDALFCLEYHYSPYELDGEHRIYQYDDILIGKRDPAQIEFVMDRIVRFDERIEQLKGG